MGKGDIKTRKGKVSNGSFGVNRPRKNNAAEEKKETPKKAS